MEKAKSTRKSSQNKVDTVLFITYVLIGILAGGLLLRRIVIYGRGMYGKAAILLVLFISVAISYVLHSVIHETGHLVFGLLSGYQFRSIRFGSMIISKKEGSLKLGRISIPGTVGQCLMAPPDRPDEDIPSALYNWGGVIFNAILSVIFGILVFSPGAHPYFIIFSIAMLCVGLLSIEMNAAPIAYLCNDGYNARCTRKDLRSKQHFIRSLRMTDMLTSGVATKDLPAEFFDWTYKDGDSAFTSGAGVQRICYLSALRRFDEALELAEYIDLSEFPLSTNNQNYTRVYKLLFMILLDKDPGEIKAYFNNEKKNMLTLRNTISAQDALYAYYTLIDKKEKEAAKAKEKFEALAKSYPYPQDLDDDRYIFSLVESKKTAAP